MRSPSAPTRRGPTWRRRCGRRACRCSASTPTAPPRDFDVLAFNLSAELVYTNLLNLVDLAGVPVRNEDRAPTRSDRDRGRALRVQPRAARRVRRRVRDRRRRRGRSARSPRWSARGSAAAARRAKPCCASSRRSPACTCPSMYDVEYDGPVDPRGHARASPTCPRSSTSAPSPTSPTGRTRSISSCRSSKSCTTGSTSRSSAAARAVVASARRA